MTRLPFRVLTLAAATVALSTGAVASDATTPASTPLNDDAEVVIVTAVRPNIWMLTVAGKNLVLETGDDGSVLVDTGPPGSSAAVLRTIGKTTTAPLRYIINTSADRDVVGNNGEVSASGHMLGGPVGPSGAQSAAADTGAPLIAHKNVLDRMISSPPEGQPYAGAALPAGAFDTLQTDLYLNGQSINVIRQPAAHSDADSIVQFQRDDVVVAGAVFDMTCFPLIDLAAGGSIDGEIAAINRLMDRYVTAVTPFPSRLGEQNGTIVVPARGRLSDQSDLAQYRDMLTIVRDRIAYYMKLGKSKQQVVALKPAAGYEPRFGVSGGSWTTDRFVEAVYQSLKNSKDKGGSTASAAQ